MNQESNIPPKNKVSFLTDDKGNKSSFRLSILILVIAAALVVVAIAFHIAFSTFSSRLIDWMGLGGFFAGYSAFITLILYQKTRQKKIENVPDQDSQIIKSN